jgi:hypothetical protein
LADPLSQNKKRRPKSTNDLSLSQWAFSLFQKAKRHINNLSGYALSHGGGTFFHRLASSYLTVVFDQHHNVGHNKPRRKRGPRFLRFT